MQCYIDSPQVSTSMVTSWPCASESYSLWHHIPHVNSLSVHVCIHPCCNRPTTCALSGIKRDSHILSVMIVVCGLVTSPLIGSWLMDRCASKVACRRRHVTGQDWLTDRRQQVLAISPIWMTSSATQLDLLRSFYGSSGVPDPQIQAMLTIW